MTEPTRMSDNRRIVEFVTVELRVVERASVPAPYGVLELLRERNLYDHAQEAVWVLTFDGGRNLRRIGEIARGSYHDVDVPIAAVVSFVQLSATDRFWLVHNHPSGLVMPTVQDIDLTHKIMAAANVSGLRMEDHIIIGPPDESFSFHENGMILLPHEITAQATTGEALLVAPVTMRHSVR